MDWLKLRNYNRANALLLSEFGEETFPNIKLNLSEKDAIKFCKDFSEDRNWCYRNGINYKVLKEEKTFQEYVIKFNFDKRRIEIEQEIRLSK
jgi:hypothetical protein